LRLAGVLVARRRLNKDDQAEYDKLNGLSGKDFDTEYITFILKAALEEAARLYMEASVAVDPTLASTVVDAMKTMHGHLGLIAEVAKQDGIRCLLARRVRAAASEFTASASRGEAVRERVGNAEGGLRALFFVAVGRPSRWKASSQERSRELLAVCLPFDRGWPSYSF